MDSTILKSLNVNGRLLDLSTPQVMGILNVAPDSFCADSHSRTEAKIATYACRILDEGTSTIDIGACSSRPNAERISSEKEVQRLRTGLGILNRNHPDAIISMNTFRAEVARRCVKEYGITIINDISAGEMNEQISPAITRLNVPCIMTHMQSAPQNMQKELHYENLLKEVFMYLARKIRRLRDLRMKGIILDPGFGSDKTLEHNYGLMTHLKEFGVFELPLLVGILHKSVIYRLFGTIPQKTLSGTTVLDTVALIKGAGILRIYDVRGAMEAVRLIEKLRSVSFHS